MGSPWLDPETIAETVYATHARLREGATVSTHLAALTQRQAGDAAQAPQPAGVTPGPRGQAAAVKPPAAGS
ncbi:three-helix bundle dimerization domain-containing protein [Streptomyces diastatochromogenes]|uniref:three-helix bundle dimerization domain-containing protein n=1 Tax=Streptomyces diastatochromogenes TaxID=42236 RepID=UPI003666D2C0